MQGGEVATTSAADTRQRSLGLKAHKSLRRKDVLVRTAPGHTTLDDHVSPPAVQDVAAAALTVDNLITPLTVGDARPLGLPPTPPIHLHDQSSSTTDLSATSGKQPKMNVSMVPNAGVDTPVNHRSPPTPESTPPRELVKTLGLLPPMGYRKPSSRTDSFKTAREEQPSSDDEQTGSHSRSLDARNESWEDLTPLAHPREPGLSLKLPRDMSPEGVDDHDITPKAEPARTEFVTFDGSWEKGHQRGAKMQEAREIASVTNLRVRKQRDKTSTAANLPVDPPPPSAAVAPSNSDTHPCREPTLRERVERNRENAERSSTQRFAEQISWPVTTTTNHTPLDDPAQAIDPRRLSGLSTTSTVIEAYVVEVPSPHRRRTLRHIRKTGDLRTRIVSAPAAVPGPQLLSASETPPGPRHRLVHKKSNDDMKRASMASDRSTVSRSMEVLPTPLEVPVVIVPNRESVARVRQHRTSTDLSSSPSDPEHVQEHNEVDGFGYFDLPRRKKRMADGGVPDTEGALQSAGLTTVRPVRALHHTDYAGRSSLQQAAPRFLADPAINGSPQAKNDSVSAKHLSAPITPYSQLSANSTSEALEVSQATAVSIYPHHNNSLLVVQQHSRPVSSERRHVPTHRSPKTPPNVSTPAENVVDSPLRNPRKPPQPPMLHVIPPTPDVLTPAAEQDRQLGGPDGRSANGRPGKALAMVRRAFSNRRYSDGFLGPFARFKGVDDLTQTTTTMTTTTTRHQSRRPSLGGRKDSKLSPFWRPRGFWDDLEVDDEDVHDEFLERGRVELFDHQPHPQQHTSTGHARRASDSDAYSRGGVDSESTSHRNSTGHSGSGSVGVSKRQRRRPPLPPPPPLQQSSSSSSSSRRHMHSIPGLGVRIEFVGWKNFQQRVQHVKDARRHRAKERQREKIKGRISTPTVIDPGMTTTTI